MGIYLVTHAARYSHGHGCVWVAGEPAFYTEWLAQREVREAPQKAAAKQPVVQDVLAPKPDVKGTPRTFHPPSIIVTLAICSPHTVVPLSGLLRGAADKDAYVNSQLYDASAAGDTALVRELLACMAEDDLSALDYAWNDGAHTALHAAARKVNVVCEPAA